MSLLTIVQEAAVLLSLPRPSVVVTSQDAAIQELFALANEEGDDLAARGQWQALTMEASFVTIAAEDQAYAVNADFGYCIPDTAFNRSQSAKLQGPLGAQLWQTMQAMTPAAPTGGYFRIRGSSFLMWPTPQAGDTIVYEYVSDYWAKTSAGTPKAAFSADADLTFLPERLMIEGLRWRYKQLKGLDYSEDLRTYELGVQRALGRDGGERALSINSGVIIDPDALPGFPNLIDA